MAEPITSDLAPRTRFSILNERQSANCFAFSISHLVSVCLQAYILQWIFDNLPFMR